MHPFTVELLNRAGKQVRASQERYRLLCKVDNARSTRPSVCLAVGDRLGALLVNVGQRLPELGS